MLVTRPVRFRRVASGLMIEKVRVIAMGNRPDCLGMGGALAAHGASHKSQEGLIGAEVT
jgi:hypothetical protein